MYYLLGLVAYCAFLFTIGSLLLNLSIVIYKYGTPLLLPFFTGAFILICILAFLRQRVIVKLGSQVLMLVVGSYVGAWSTVAVLKYWGTTAAYLGLLFMGVGVVPMGMVASLFAGEILQCFIIIALPFVGLLLANVPLVILGWTSGTDGNHPQGTNSDQGRDINRAKAG